MCGSDVAFLSYCFDHLLGFMPPLHTEKIHELMPKLKPTQVMADVEEEPGTPVYVKWLIVATHSNRQAIIFSSCGVLFLSSVFLFFLAYSQPSQTECLPYFHTWCGLSANLECSAACGSLKIHDAKITKKSPSAHHRTTLLGYIFATKIYIDSQKKSFKQQYLLHMLLQYGELRPTNGWDLLASLGHPSKFQLLSRLGFVTAPTSFNGGQQNFAGCFAVSWAGTL